MSTGKMSTGKMSTGKTNRPPPIKRQTTEKKFPHLTATGVGQKPSLPGPSKHPDARVLRFNVAKHLGTEHVSMPPGKHLGTKVHFEMLNEILDETKLDRLSKSSSFEDFVHSKDQCGDKKEDSKLTCYQKILASAAEDGMDQAQAAQHIENFYNAITCKSFEGEYRCDKDMALCTPKKRGGKKKQRGGASAFIVRSLTCLTILASVFGTGYTFMLILYFFGFNIIAENVAARSEARVEGCGNPVDGLNRHFTRRAFETWLDGPPGEGGVGLGGRDCSTEWVDLQGSGDRALERIMGYVAYFRLIAAGAGLYAYDAIYNFINAQLDSWGMFPGNNPHNLGGGNKPTRRRRRKKRGGRKKTKRKARKGRKSRKRRSTKRKRKSRKH